MFSIVIPTMWRSQKIEKLLQDLNQSDFVNEIIIIDNDTKSKSIELSQFSKLRYFPQVSNIFVNPAWNLGVLYAQNELIAICNDDINFDVDSVLNQVLENQNDLGVIGCRLLDDKNPNKKIKLNTYREKSRATVVHSFGVLMFVKKSKWIDIPNDLKIYYGDNWIMETQNPVYSMTFNGRFDIDRHATTKDKSLNIKSITSVDTTVWQNLILTGVIKNPFK